MSRLLPRFDESFIATSMPPSGLDALWAQGWRHQGALFFRYTHCMMEGVEHDIVPLRIDLDAFKHGKSQRRLWNRNQDIEWEVKPTVVDDRLEEMFRAHSTRFAENVPGSIGDFLGPEPDSVPARTYTLRASLKRKVIAASFIGVGAHCVSSLYAIYDPAYAERGLGNLTLLKEIEIARNAGKRFLYQGFGTPKRSRYEYKMRFRGTMGLDWTSGNWFPLAEVPVMQARFHPGEESAPESDSPGWMEL
jgi:leucyl-tRNA---protein transferase